MSTTRILWGQITLVCLIVLITMWAATQWVAWKLGYQAQLGPPWFELGEGRPVYVPPAFFWWWYAFDAYAPEIFVEGAGIAASGGILSIVVAFGMSVWRAREAKTAATYGSARWAVRHEIDSAGLLRMDGVVLGVLSRGPVCFNALQRAMPGVSHRMTVIPRGLERDSLVRRIPLTTISPRVATSSGRWDLPSASRSRRSPAGPVLGRIASRQRSAFAMPQTP